jgi:hypothetical protein
LRIPRGFGHVGIGEGELVEVSKSRKGTALAVPKTVEEIMGF